MNFQALRSTVIAIFVLAVTASNANAATGPAMPWEFTTSSNTDPRLGLVAVHGPEEGGQFIAGCSGTTLYKGRVAQQPDDEVFSLEEIAFAEECRPGDDVSVSTQATPGTPRMINTDYQVDWVILPMPTYGPPTEDTPVVEFAGMACSGTTGVTFYLTAGFPNWQLTPNVYECGARNQSLTL